MLIAGRENNDMDDVNVETVKRKEAGRKCNIPGGKILIRTEFQNDFLNVNENRLRLWDMK
jgi:hypothetical protein